MSGGNGLTNNDGNVVSVELGLLLPFIYGSKSPKLTSSNEAAVSKSSFNKREFKLVSLPHAVEKSNELKSVCHCCWSATIGWIGWGRRGGGGGGGGIVTRTCCCCCSSCLTFFVARRLAGGLSVFVFLFGLALFVVRADLSNKLSFCPIGVVCSKRWIVSIILSTPETGEGLRFLSNVLNVRGSTTPFTTRQFPPSSKLDWLLFVWAGAMVRLEWDVLWTVSSEKKKQRN